MSTLAVLDELPSGYFVEETPRGILQFRASDLSQSPNQPADDSTLTVTLREPSAGRHLISPIDFSMPHFLRLKQKNTKIDYTSGLQKKKVS